MSWPQRYNYFLFGELNQSFTSFSPPFASSVTIHFGAFAENKENTLKRLESDLSAILLEPNFLYKGWILKLK